VTTLGSDSTGTAVDAALDWVEMLTASGPKQDAAMRELHDLLLRASRRQVQRMRAQLRGAGPEVIDEIANQCADEAMMAVLAKLATFEGRSRFTTWAYKFAVLQAATEVRSRAWHGRDVNLEGLDLLVDAGAAPEHYAEAADLADVVRNAIQTVLSPHQRRILVALVIEDVPIDVLAERLGATRNALYKTLHDARKRLRSHLRSTGHMADIDQQVGTS
jgi:RNA polymerase sigma-70 factor, ECF subfamily